MYHDFDDHDQQDYGSYVISILVDHHVDQHIPLLIVSQNSSQVLSYLVRAVSL